MNVQRAHSSRSLVALATLLAVGGCDCSDDAPRRALTIADPVCDSTLTLADDADSATAGLQYDVVIETDGLDGEEVSLFLDAVSADIDPPVEMSVSEGGQALMRVTFPAGNHRLQARAREGGVQSEVCRIQVEDECASIAFITPTPEGGTELTLGPAADTDGEMCGTSFETEFVISTSAPNGSEATIFVNGTPRGTTLVSEMVARFRGISLDGRGTTPNVVRVEVSPSPGLTCSRDFPANIFVDCAGPSCIITQPATDSAFLNRSDDTSDAEGFQTDFVITTDADGAGQPVRLIIDGDVSGAREVSPTMVGSGAQARFGNVPLSEGLHRVVGECFDAAGNPFRAGPAEWTVDITPCTAIISSIAGGSDPVTDFDDLDDTAAGIQVEVEGSVEGEGCGVVRVGRCGSLADATVTGTTYTRTITLGSSATQDVCVEVLDEAGNIGTAMQTVNVRTDAPQLEIVTPTTGTAYNREGTGGRTADLNDTTTACDVAFTVNCTDVGVPVQLVDDGSGAVLATADCAAMAGLPSPYMGQATFASVAIPSIDSGGSMAVVARQTVAGLVGLSAPVSITPDCNAPDLMITRPMCGATLRPSVDDEDSATAGLQYQVQVLNDNPGPPPVILTVRNSDGTIVTMPTSSTRLGARHTVFNDVNLGSGGMLTLEACATDTAGNTFCTAGCTVTVADLPTLSITQPTGATTLTEADDCDATAPGLQIRVRATTNAADGSPATVQVGGGTVVNTAASGGVIDVCVPAMDGRAINVAVTVTDSVRGMATALVMVDIDTMAPTNPVSDLAATIIDRRGGVVRFTWTSVEDAGGALLDRWELRCADTAITSDAAWVAADVVPGLTVAPASSGTVQTQDLSGFRPGEPRFCTLRGYDVAGRLTPLGNDVDASVAFMQTEVTATATSQLGIAIAPIGDVNGDGIDDVLIGAPAASGAVVPAKAYVYFGSTTGLSTSPSVTIVGTHSTFGLAVRGIGDFNGDGRPDFAVAEQGRTGGGAVYLFYGRSSASPWPSTVLLTTGSCGADICFVASGGSGFFGWSVGSLDFNGDGYADLVVGAPAAASGTTSLAGRVYVLLGSGGFAANASVDVPLGAISPSAGQPAGFYYENAAARLLGVANTAYGTFTGTAEDDLVVGAPGLTSAAVGGRIVTIAGRAYSAGAVGLVQITTGTATLDSAASSGLGENLAMSDHNGDGRADLLSYEATSAGRIHIYPRSATGFTAASRVTSENDLASPGNDRYGFSLPVARHPWLGVVGDIDGDGVDELSAGSRERGVEGGSVDMFYGGATISARPRSQADFVFQPATSAGPRTVSFIGDVNGDGFDDIAAGDPAYMTSAGRVFILY